MHTLRHVSSSRHLVGKPWLVGRARLNTRLHGLQKHAPMYGSGMDLVPQLALAARQHAIDHPWLRLHSSKHSSESARV